MQNKFNKEIEEIKITLTKDVEKTKADLATSKEIMNLSLLSLAKEREASQAKRIRSMEAVWKEILSIRRMTSMVVIFYTILLPTEYEEQIKKDKIIDIDSLEKFYAEYNKKMNLNGGIEECRIFIGETLWLYFWSYRAFFLRLAFQVIKHSKVGKAFNWSEDNLMLNHMKNLLNKNEMEFFEKAADIEKLNAVRVFMERHIIDEINIMLSGKAAAETSLEQARKITELSKAEMLVNKNFD